MNKIPTFKIKITKQVIFKDPNGVILKLLEVDDMLEATADIFNYYETSMGGIFHDEAEVTE